VADPAQCPGLDADGDGVLNGVDACPTVPAATVNGCPATEPVVEPVVEPVAPAPPVDTDGDGVADAVDACPAVAGSQADGCPPPPPVVAEEPVKPAPQVELKNDHLELRGAVYFDTSKAVLQARSFALLNEVAAVLKAHPDVKKVSIEGHTDAQGDAAFNQRLSLERAKAVKTYLEQHGVEAGRLQTKGFGQSKPIAPHNTPEGREKNRRVEFIVLE
jgi:outer membrane protein OmpA-like peptidoglycan-associated protein